MGCGERVRDADGLWTAWDGLNLELVSPLHMHVASFHSAPEPRDCQVLQPPCSLPLSQLVQKLPKCLSRSLCSSPTHPLSPDPSSLSTDPSFPAEKISGTVSFLPFLLPTENICCSEVLSPRAQGPAWGWKGDVEPPTPRAS